MNGYDSLVTEESIQMLLHSELDSVQSVKANSSIIIITSKSNDRDEGGKFANKISTPNVPEQSFSSSPEGKKSSV